MDHRKTWTSLKKRKQRRTNENTSMSEEVKVYLANDDLAIVSSGQKIALRENKGSINFGNLKAIPGMLTETLQMSLILMNPLACSRLSVVGDE